MCEFIKAITRQAGGFFIFVGKGVQPTAAVEPSVADLRAGRDAALEWAVAALQDNAVTQQ